MVILVAECVLQHLIYKHSCSHTRAPVSVWPIELSGHVPTRVAGSPSSAASSEVFVSKSLGSKLPTKVCWKPLIPTSFQSFQQALEAFDFV